MIGAVIVRHWRMDLHKTILFTLLVTLTTLVSNSVYLMSCPSPKIVGLNVGYEDSTQLKCVAHFEAQLLHMHSNVRLENSCNDRCQCRQADYRPVCSRELDLTFYSPCVAGCHVQEQGKVGVKEQLSLAERASTDLARMRLSHQYDHETIQGGASCSRGRSRSGAATYRQKHAYRRRGYLL